MSNKNENIEEPSKSHKILGKLNEQLAKMGIA